MGKTIEEKKNIKRIFWNSGGNYQYATAVDYAIK